MYVDTAPETRPRSATPGSTAPLRLPVMQITKADALISASRYFSSSRDLTAIRGGAPARRAVRTRSAHVREVRGNLARTRRPVVPRYSGQVAVSGPAGSDPRRGPGWPGPVVILRAGRDAGVQVGSIVMALSPPRYLARSPLRRGAGPGRVGPAGGTSSAPRRAVWRCSPVPVSHLHPSARCPRLPTEESAEHQFQLRTGSSPPVDAFPRYRVGHRSCCAWRHPLGRRVAGSGSSDPAAVVAQLRSVRRATAGCGHASRCVVPSPTLQGCAWYATADRVGSWSTVIDSWPQVRSACTASSRAPPDR